MTIIQSAQLLFEFISTSIKIPKKSYIQEIGNQLVILLTL